jgi:hypothetical protein
MFEAIWMNKKQKSFQTDVESKEFEHHVDLADLAFSIQLQRRCIERDNY